MRLDYKSIITKHYLLHLSGKDIADQIGASKSGVNGFLKAFEQAKGISYIYAASVLYCLTLCITVAKLNRKDLITAIILLFTLFSCLPSYVETRQNEKNDDVKTAYTLGKIAECGITEGTVLTNNDFFSWTIFEYYVPGTPCQKVAPGFGDFKDNTTYYLAWKNALSESENAWLSDNNYSAELVISDGFLGSDDFYIYRLIHNK